MSHPALADTLLEAIRYEHWLRFYFLDVPEDETDAAGEDALKAVLRVPQACAEASRRAEPHLFPLLEALRDREIALDGARDSVFRHVARAVGVDEADAAFGEELFQLVADPDFRRGMDAFHGWVQELANGEVTVEDGGGVAPGTPEADDVPPSFAVWQAAFREWAARQAVRHVTTISPFPSGETR